MNFGIFRLQNSAVESLPPFLPAKTARCKTFVGAIICRPLYLAKTVQRKKDREFSSSVLLSLEFILLLYTVVISKEGYVLTCEGTVDNDHFVNKGIKLVAVASGCVLSDCKA